MPLSRFASFLSFFSRFALLLHFHLAISVLPSNISLCWEFVSLCQFFFRIWCFFLCVLVSFSLSFVCLLCFGNCSALAGSRHSRRLQRCFGTSRYCRVVCIVLSSSSSQTQSCGIPTLVPCFFYCCRSCCWILVFCSHRHSSSSSSTTLFSVCRAGLYRWSLFLSFSNHHQQFRSPPLLSPYCTSLFKHFRASEGTDSCIDMLLNLRLWSNSLQRSRSLVVVKRFLDIDLYRFCHMTVPRPPQARLRWNVSVHCTRAHRASEKVNPSLLFHALLWSFLTYVLYGCFPYFLFLLFLTESTLKGPVSYHVCVTTLASHCFFSPRSKLLSLMVQSIVCPTLLFSRVPTSKSSALLEFYVVLWLECVVYAFEEETSLSSPLHLLLKIYSPWNARLEVHHLLRSYLVFSLLSFCIVSSWNPVDFNCQSFNIRLLSPFFDVP